MRIYKRENGYFYIDVTVHGRRVRRGLKTRTRAEAQRRGLALVADLEAQGAEPWTARKMRIAPLINQYIQSHYGARPNPRRENERRRVLLCCLGGLNYLGELTTAAVDRGIREAAERYRWANGTRNTYRDTVSAFCGWLFRRGLLRSNPVKPIQKLPTPAKRERRALTARELAALLETSPLHRAGVYAVAAGVGLRRMELAALEWEDLDLAGAVVHVRAETTKTRKGATLPLASWVVGYLERWRKQFRPGRPLRPGCGHVMPATGKVWAAIPHHATVKKDLLAAGIAPQTTKGRVDLHALRVTFGTLLAQSGTVSVAVAMRLLRHSDPRLTLRVYTKLVDEDLRKGVDALQIPGYDHAAAQLPPAPINYQELMDDSPHPAGNLPIGHGDQIEAQPGVQGTGPDHDPR